MGMFYFSSFPFLRLVPAFVTGIVAYIYLHPAYSSWLVSGFAALLYTIADLLWLKLYRNYRFRYISGMASAVLMFSLGMAVACTNDPLQQPGFFTHIKNINAYNGFISDTPAEKENAWKATI